MTDTEINGLTFSGLRIDNGESVHGWHLEIGGKPYIRTFPKKKDGVSWDHFVKPGTVKVKVAGEWFNSKELTDRICS